jgi:phosphomannomutase
MESNMSQVPDIVLFDMDGTLTPAREQASPDVIESLIDLLQFADVGIVTGADLDGILRQCDRPALREGILNSDNAFWLLSCNGTQVHVLNPHTEEWEQITSVKIRDKIGTRWMNYLYMEIFEAQNRLILREADLPFSPPFIQERQGLINWSLVGQSADQDSRRKFEVFDAESLYRDKKVRMLERLQAGGDLHPFLSFKIGGASSIDIYPKGWDKTYALRHFADQDAWFVGNQCKPGGNDYEIYEALSEDGRGFETSGPLDTIRIINEVIKPGVE